MTRIVTSVALLLFALYSIFLAPQWLFAVIVAAVASLCYHEFAGISAASGVEGPLWAGYAAGLITMFRPEVLPLLVPVVLALALASRDLAKSLSFSGALVMGVLYTYIGWRWAIPLREMGVHWLLFALSINWVGDVAAYYVGRSIGKHKLAPRVSPGKSWEGAIGSAIAAIIFGVIFGAYFAAEITPLNMAVLSLVANIAGQTGDLAESALKRGAGVKDSGTLLPGHGGALDRLDSSLFTVPVVYFYLTLLAGHLSIINRLL